jgi:hypothetical protein
MSARRFAKPFIALWVSMAALQISAQPRPTPGSEDIRPLFVASDVVCLGRVESISNAGTVRRSFGSTYVPVQTKIATFVVERYYKSGDGSSSIQLRFYEPLPTGETASAALPFLTLENKEHALVFLKRTGDVLEFVDPWFSKLPMSPYLAREARQGLDMLEADLEAGLDDPQPQSVRNNLEILGGMKKLEQTSKIRQLAMNPDLETKAAAVLALQRVGDYSQLKQCLEMMSLSGVPPTIMEMRRLMASTFESVDDRKAVPTLLRFADSPDSTVRASVMKALRKLNDPRSVPTIVKRLEDPDFFIRYDAVFTLATIEGRQNPEWAPGLGEYKVHESKYIAQWKKWWTEEGSAKYRDAVPD